MTAAKALEYRIIRQKLAQPVPREAPGQGFWVDRLIAVLAATTGLVALGAVLQELVWVAIVVAAVVALGVPGART